eukprot:scaffold4649_cov72-Cyclotella_meneghiniana.AAC.14
MVGWFFLFFFFSLFYYAGSARGYGTSSRGDRWLRRGSFELNDNAIVVTASASLGCVWRLYGEWKDSSASLEQRHRSELFATNAARTSSTSSHVATR